MKPSERIKELMNIACAFPRGTIPTLEDYVKAIVEYLDEQSTRKGEE